MKTHAFLCKPRGVCPSIPCSSIVPQYLECPYRRIGPAADLDSLKGPKLAVRKAWKWQNELPESRKMPKILTTNMQSPTSFVVIVVPLGSVRPKWVFRPERKGSTKEEAVYGAPGNCQSTKERVFLNLVSYHLLFMVIRLTSELRRRHESFTSMAQ